MEGLRPLSNDTGWVLSQAANHVAELCVEFDLSAQGVNQFERPLDGGSWLGFNVQQRLPSSSFELVASCFGFQGCVRLAVITPT